MTLPRPRPGCKALRLGIGFLLGTATASAQSGWLTRAWQSDEGLPNQHVTALAQSRDGYVWVATMTGLARFDGSRFTPVFFDVANRHRAPEQGVGGVIPLSDGGVLISRLRGPVVRLSADGGALETVATGVPPGLMPLAAVEDAKHGIWIGYASSILVHVANGRSRRFGKELGVPEAGTIYSLACDRGGTVWLAKGSSVLIFRNGRFQPFVPIENGASRADKFRLCACRSSGVWIIDTPGRLYHADADGGMKYYGKALVGFPNATSVNVMEDDRGAVWVGTDLAGLFRFDDGRFERIATTVPSITSLLETRDGAVFAGTAGGGLDRLSPRRVVLENVATDRSELGATSITQDSEGAIWATTRDGAVLRRVRGAWRQAFGAQVGVATCIAGDRRGGVWIGTRAGRIFRWNGNLRQVDPGRASGAFVCALLVDSNGDLWVGRYFGQNRIQRLRGGNWKTFSPPRNPGRIFAMTEDSSGRVWIGTRRGLLLRADGDTLTDETPKANPGRWPVRALVRGPDGAIWIGYGGIGLGRFRDGVLSHLDSSRGLPDDYVSQIIADDRGWAWFGADHGVFKVRWRDLETAMRSAAARIRPVLFGPSDGLRNLQAGDGVSPETLRSRDGRIWLTMRTGIAIAERDSDGDESRSPAVLLESVSVGERAFAAYDAGVLPGNIRSLRGWRGPVRLRPDQTRITFRFAALNYTAPENVHYRYRLDALDKGWIEAGSDRTATYSHLGPGTYRFRVQACVGDSPWSEASSPLGIVVVPYFWQTLWFRLLVLAFFTTGGALFARSISHRRFRLRVRALEQQAALEKERSRIGRDLHDNLGGTLTQVSLMLDIAGRESQGAGRDRLEHCSAMVRQVARSVDEIIWAVNPRNDTVEYLVDYLGQYVVEFLHAAEIRCRVDIPDRLPAQEVNPEMRHHLFLAVKECLNNVARHAHATQVSLSVVATDTELAIAIADDGRGFDSVPNNGRSDGLRNMRDRMSEIGGRFEIDSRRGAGTRVAFVCRLDNASK